MRGPLIALAAAVALAACSPGQSSPNASEVAEFRQFYEYLSGGTPMEDAREQGLSEAQFEILERAAARGEVTLADLQEALNNVYGCFDEQGITHSEQAITYMGHDEISYSYGAPPGYADDDPAWLALADSCVRSESGTIDMLFQMQPGVAVAQEEWFAKNLRDELSACLARFGVTAPAGADSNWYAQAVTDLSQPQNGGVDECDVLYVNGIYGK